MQNYKKHLVMSKKNRNFAPHFRIMPHKGVIFNAKHIFFNNYIFKVV